MSKLTSPRDLLIEELKDLYSAESQLIKALPKMAKAADSEELKSAFENHLVQTKTHAERLEQVMEDLEESPKGQTCKAMKGLIEEGKEVMEEDAEAVILDLALITAAQKVEHYEISAYGTARTMAGQIGQPSVAELLSKSLAEEEVADSLLTQIARELMGAARGLAKEPFESPVGATRSKSRASGRANRSK